MVRRQAQREQRVIPSVVGLLVVGLGLVLIYVGLHGGGFLDVQPKGLYEVYAGQAPTTGRNPT